MYYGKLGGPLLFVHALQPPRILRTVINRHLHSIPSSSFRSHSSSMSEPHQASEVSLSWVDTTHTGTDDSFIHVSLKEVAPDEKEAGNIDQANSKKETDVDGIPASVLQYQRQLRKAQHARKLTREITIEKDLHVVYEDEHLIVVNKPPGVLTVPGINQHASLLSLVCEAYPDSTMEPANRIIHRLDMDTSGLVIFSRSKEVTKLLHASFRDHKVNKEYECIVMGHWCAEDPNENSTSVYHIELPLQRDHEHPPFMRVSTPKSEVAAMAAVDALKQHGFKKLVRKRPKPSSTRVRVVEHDTLIDKDSGTPLPYSRLRLEPLTGRTHQLRVHCAALGYPILGDSTYTLGGEAAAAGGLARIERSVAPCPVATQNAWASVYAVNVQPMCLHAAFLQLEHPITHEPLEWEVAPEFPIVNGSIVNDSTIG